MSEVEVIGAAHARMSSDMQNERSPEDQVRRCRERAGCDGVTIPDENVFIERAVSGTKADRAVLEELKAAAKTKRFSVLYVEDLSRLSRESTHLMALLKELVFDGIRVISVNEGIDSDNESWHILATILGLHHEQYIRDLGKRVHRGQASAVLGGRSAGDYRFGYTSQPAPGHQRRARDRNRRPHMLVTVDAEQARWVMKIFVWFAVDGRSMNWIAGELTRLNVPKDHRSSTPGWHHSYVKRILTCRKYVGVWEWGRRRNRRNPATGRVFQAPAPDGDQVVDHRPALRVVPQPLWDRAQARLSKIKEHYPGPTGAALRSGASYVDLYPKNGFSGLVFCAACGARFVGAGSNGKYIGCSGQRMHRCDVRTLAPRALMRTLLIEQLRSQALISEQRVDELLVAVKRAAEAEGSSAPAELAVRKAELDRLAYKVRNLNTMVEEGGCDLRSTARRIAELEARQKGLEIEIAELERRQLDSVKLPTRDWLLSQLQTLDQWLSEDPRELAELFRVFTGGRIEMAAVIPPGKKRGFFQARFGANAFAVAADRGHRAATDEEDCDSARLLRRACLNATFEETVTMDLKRSSRAAQLADRVRHLREGGVLWKDIRKSLRCGYQTAKSGLSLADASAA